jgi:hypothetical protein
MKTLHFEHLADGRAQLRVAVAAIDEEMSIISGNTMRDDPHATSDRLVAAWGQLVQLLALGPTPSTRQCPVCANVGMREAIRCGYCWTKLTPVNGLANAA